MRRANPLTLKNLSHILKCTVSHKERDRTLTALAVDRTANGLTHMAQDN